MSIQISEGAVKDLRAFIAAFDDLSDRKRETLRTLGVDAFNRVEGEQLSLCYGLVGYLEGILKANDV